MQVTLTDAAGDVPVSTPDYLDITEMRVSFDDDALTVRFEVAGDVPEAPEVSEEGGLVLHLGRDGGDASVDPPEYWVDIYPEAGGWKATFLQWRRKWHTEVDLDVEGNSLTATMPLSMLVPTDVLDEPDVQADMLVHGIGGYRLFADADHVPDGTDAWVPLGASEEVVVDESSPSAVAGDEEAAE